MAIISCRECSGQVSDTAATCPHCGAAAGKPQVVAIEKKSGNVWPWVVFGFMVLVMFIILNAVFSKPTEQDMAKKSYDACMDSLATDDRARRGNGNFIAGACENMRNDYIRKYGNTP